MLFTAIILFDTLEDLRVSANYRSKNRMFRYFLNRLEREHIAPRREQGVRVERVTGINEDENKVVINMLGDIAW